MADDISLRKFGIIPRPACMEFVVYKIALEQVLSLNTSVSLPVPVTVRSKALVCSHSPVEIVGSNPTGGMDVCLLWVLCVVR